MYFFREILSFIFRLKNKIIFSGKRNIVFPDNTRKILFQCDFFGKTIFSGRLEKENMVFCPVLTPKTSFSILSHRKQYSLEPGYYNTSYIIATLENLFSLSCVENTRFIAFVKVY